VDYKIRQSNRSQAAIWSDLRAAQAAGEFKDFLPTGVSKEQASFGLAAVDWSAGLGLQWDPADKVSVKTTDEDVEGPCNTSTSGADGTNSMESTSSINTEDNTLTKTDTDASTSTSTSVNPVGAVARTFISTPPIIHYLRALSKQGKAEMLKEEEKGTKPVVWGVDQDEGSKSAL
jgi:hypothetical protein